MHRRRLLIVAALACWMQACSAYAQSKIEVPERVALGEPIVASVTLPEGGKVAWKAGPGVSLIDVGEGKAHLWAKPGTGTIEAVVVSVKDGQLGSLDWLSATFLVGDAPPPVPPGPNPPTPPGPLPEPIPGTLAALVPADARLPLSQFYADLASVVRSGTITSVGHFRRTQAEAVKAFQAAGKLPSVAAINQPINDRLVKAVGLDDAPLDAGKREALAAALDSIAKEFIGA